jgi:hypothetical protein
MIRILSPDQGVCPFNHRCALDPEHPTLRVCDERHEPFNLSPGAPFVGDALVDVYAGPCSPEEYHAATRALVLVMDWHPDQHEEGDPCPGVEVCDTIAAGLLRDIQNVLDPLPREVTA